MITSPRRALLAATRVLTTPLLPDDYLGLINPLWSAQPHARVTARREVGQATTELTLRPGAGWTGHRPGQHVGVGVEIAGRWHWRTYSPTSAPGDPLTIAVTALPDGSVSPHLARTVRPGDVVRLGPADGGALDLDVELGPLLLVSAGSGVTPVLGLLRGLAARGEDRDVVVVHNGRDAATTVHGPDLRALAGKHSWLRLHERHTAREGRLTPTDLAALAPDWQDRTTVACGPGGLLDTLAEAYRAADVPLRTERFRPPTLAAGVDLGVEGVRAATFTRSGTSIDVNPAETLLAAGERAGVLMPSGCRMGICRTCVSHLSQGTVLDLRTGERHDAGTGQTVQTCVTTAAGDVHLDL